MANSEMIYELDESSSDIIRNLYKADDRVAAVVGCALLEEALIDALNARIFEGSPTVGARTPLSRLIPLAQQLGIISPNIAEGLSRHSRIRNALTHSSNLVMGFDHDEVKDDVHHLDTVPTFVAALGHKDGDEALATLDQLPINTFKGRWLVGVQILLVFLRMLRGQISRVGQVPSIGLRITFPARDQ